LKILTEFSRARRSEYLKIELPHCGAICGENIKIHDRTLLLDLGGVLADLGDPVSAMDLSMTPEEFWTAWLSSAHVRAFETGRLTTAEFCADMGPALGASGGAGFEARFRNWQLRLFPGVEEFVQSLAGRYNIALLSNTNVVHWSQLSSTDVFSRFDRTFLSFETGHFKPAPAAFEQVIACYGCDPGDILFIDDSPKNVEAACKLGIDGRLAHGLSAVSEIVADI
jgi:putative hydrolase of the HAD superfamily